MEGTSPTQVGGGDDTAQRAVKRQSTPPVIAPDILSSKEEISCDKTIFVTKTGRMKTKKGEVVGTSRMVEECRHDEDGECHLHGGGAARRWKSEKTTVVGGDGVKTIKMGRQAGAELCQAQTSLN